MLLHGDLDDPDDDLSVTHSHDVDFFLFDDHSNDDLVLKLLVLSSAC